MRRPTKERRVLCLLALGVLGAAPVLAGPGGGAPTSPVAAVNVTGTGEVHVPPDEAILRLGVVAQAPSAREAQRSVNKVAGEVVTAMRKAGAEQLQTSQLQMEPIYAPKPPPLQTSPGEPPEIVAYRASNVVTVRLTALDRVGPVIDAGLEKGANRLEGLHFRLRDDLRARTEALKEAATAARQKGVAIATALGGRLGGVLEVSEGGGVVVPLAESRALAPEPAAESTPVSPGLITVSGQVQVRYRFIPGARERARSPGVGGAGEQAPE